MLTEEQRNRVVYHFDGQPVTVADVMEMADNGETCFETCAYCDEEAEIPVTGGYCPSCGMWNLPCSMCDPFLTDCDCGGELCPYHPLKPIIQTFSTQKE